MAKRDMPGWWNVEIDWLANCSEGEHGRRAVPLEPGLGAVPDEMEDRRCEAVQRARRINAALAAIPRDAARLLLCAHEYVAPGRCKEAHAAHGRLTGAVSDLLAASAAFRRAWLAYGAPRGGNRVAA